MRNYLVFRSLFLNDLQNNKLVRTISLGLALIRIIYFQFFNKGLWQILIKI